MYQNGYVLEQLSRLYVQDRQHDAQEARKARLAQVVRRGLRRPGR